MQEEDKDRYALIFTGPIFLLSLLAGSGAWVAAQGTKATAWLMQKNILVPEDQSIITFFDAGLDTPRCVLIAALVFLGLWGIIAVARKKRQRRFV